jgi:hypothetical protein
LVDAGFQNRPYLHHSYLALCTLLSGVSEFVKHERRQHLAPMPEWRSHLFRIGIRQMAEYRSVDVVNRNAAANRSRPTFGSHSAIGCVGGALMTTTR